MERQSSVRSSLNVKSRSGYLFLKNSTCHSSDKDSISHKFKQKVTQKKYCRFKYFESLPKFTMDQPILGAGGSPSREEKDKIEKDENKKKWVTQRDFMSYVGGK